MFSNLIVARAQMGTSLVFHVIFSVLGVGLPLLLCLAEGLALWRKDGTWLSLSRQWTTIPFQIISGDFNARALEITQPLKYAAMEGVIHSGYGLPLYIGGIVDPASRQVKYAIQIPHGESLISHFDLNSYTRGLDSFPANL